MDEDKNFIRGSIILFLIIIILIILTSYYTRPVVLYNGGFYEIIEFNNKVYLHDKSIYGGFSEYRGVVPGS